MGKIYCRYQAGAGEGNRTLVISLEGFSSTIELHPQRFIKSFANNLHSNLLTRFYVKFLLQLLLSLILILTAGGESWIRTNVGVSQQIYSLPPLAARASLREPNIFSCSATTVNLQVLLSQVKTPRP